MTKYRLQRGDTLRIALRVVVDLAQHPAKLRRAGCPGIT
jgi:hypothetical protein